MTTKSQVFKCNACGAIMAVITNGEEKPVFCDLKMLDVSRTK